MKFLLLLCLAAVVPSIAARREQHSTFDHDNSQLARGPHAPPIAQHSGSGFHHQPDTRCAALCAKLKRQFPSEESGYTQGQQLYWSQQQQHCVPTCRIAPVDADQVSTVIKQIQRFNCPFAVKSGGHGSFLGASNIPNGITIDLRKLNTINVLAEQNVTQLGTGNRWEDVYSKLDPLDLAVIGGRNGDIGVGGLTLGGGISFYSGFHGWACDNVENYEVVLANGSIVEANPESNRDLFFALRGGGNNFGIVTRMDLKTFKQGQMWGGSTVYSPDKNASLYDAFYWFNRNAHDDPNAALIVSAACVKKVGCLFSNNYNYIQPQVDPPVFENFTRIEKVASTQRIAKLSNFTAELKATQPPGYRQAFWSITVKNDADLMKTIYNEIWHPAVQPLMDIEGFLGTLVFQPVTEPIIENFAKNGGNALGIDCTDGPLVILNMDFQWNSTCDDDQILGTQEDIIARSRALAESRGLSHRYIYQNYAYITQDVFDSYGPDSKARLLEVQSKYDPERLFLRLQPGYFKLR